MDHKPKAWIVLVSPKGDARLREGCTGYFSGFTDQDDAISAVQRHLAGGEQIEIKSCGPLLDGTVEDIGILPGQVRLA